MQKALSDFWLFVCFYPVAALAVVHIGNDRSFFELFQTPSYYSDLVLAFVLSYGIGIYLHLFYKKFRLSIMPPLRRQLLWILLWSLIVPWCFATISEILYLVLFLKIPIKESPIFYLESPLILLFLIMANSFYMISHALHMPNFAAEPSKNAPKTQLTVTKGTTSKIISVSEIARIELIDKTTYLTTFENEKYVIQDSLQTLASKLSIEDFFQVNRQLLAHKKSITSFESTATRKIKVLLKPASTDTYYVSKARAGAFTRWIQEL